VLLVRAGGRRRGSNSRRLVAVALLALAALVSIDCLNLVQSEAWTDLTRAPHLAAISRVTDGGTPKLSGRAAPNPFAAVVPPDVELFVACLCWVLGLETSSTLLFARPRVRRRLRAPPALRFDWGTPLIAVG
jgi:hypothetical protein